MGRRRPAKPVSTIVCCCVGHAPFNPREARFLWRDPLPVRVSTTSAPSQLPGRPIREAPELSTHLQEAGTRPAMTDLHVLFLWEPRGSTVSSQCPKCRRFSREMGLFLSSKG